MVNRIGLGSLVVVLLSITFSDHGLAMEVSKQVFANYQAYLEKIGSTKRGVFAVSTDGRSSWFLYCESNCIPTGIGEAALQKCRSVSGQECTIAANGRTLRVELTVRP